VGRLAGGDQAHPGEAEGFAGGFGEAQVAVVDRVEGAAEDAQRAGLRPRHRGDLAEHVEGVGVEAGEHHRDEDRRQGDGGSWPSRGETRASTPISRLGTITTSIRPEP
jgi:hypothetical protein